MSTRDDQPVTVPPPAGEDDAYSATTKVGAMPADIMEKLRAEGLLPEDAQEDRQTPSSSFRPSTSLEKRATAPLVSGPPVNDGAPVPQLYSTAPPALKSEGDDESARESQSKILTAKPPPMPAEGAPVSEAIETPVAFAFPPVSQPPVAEPAGSAGLADDPSSEERQDTTALTNVSKQKAVSKPPSMVTMVVVAVFVVVLLIVALMRLRG